MSNLLQGSCGRRRGDSEVCCGRHRLACLLHVPPMGFQRAVCGLCCVCWRVQPKGPPADLRCGLMEQSAEVLFVQICCSHVLTSTTGKAAGWRRSASENCVPG